VDGQARRHRQAEALALATRGSAEHQEGRAHGTIEKDKPANLVVTAPILRRSWARADTWRGRRDGC
jgi:hypothetical protein